MDTASCWELFCATGDPMAYLLYREEGLRESREYSKEKQEYNIRIKEF